MSRKIVTTVYITEDQQNLLKTLNERSKVPIAEYIRQGIDLVLEKYRDQLPGQMDLSPLPSGRLDETVKANVGATYHTEIDTKIDRKTGKEVGARSSSNTDTSTEIGETKVHHG